MRQRLGHPAPVVPPGFRGFRGTPLPGQKASHRTDTNVPNFSTHRAGLTGIGLTSGLKVSQPASIVGSDTFAKSH